jgi:hypothetical protein
MIPQLEEALVEFSPTLQERIQKRLEEDTDFYIQNVRKGQWPAGKGYAIEYSPSPFASSDRSFGVTIRTFSLKKAAVNSPDICLSGLRQEDEVKQMTEMQERILAENARHIWTNTFQDEVLRQCETRLILRRLTYDDLKEILEIAKWNGSEGRLTLVRSRHSSDPEYTGTEIPGLLMEGINYGFVRYPPRVNFRGKRVNPYITQKVKGSYKAIMNRKYKRAAEQVVIYHPEMVEFLFPDLKHWAGEVVFRCIPDRDSNPNGDKGFFRMLFAYGAKPERPELGTVITVLPPGIKGWLWYWVWKLIGFKP